MNLAARLLIASSVLVALGVTVSASAQRRTPPAVPVELRLTPDASRGPSPYRYVVTLTAREPVEIAADRRLLWLEVLPAGARRPLRCESPARPRRPAPDRQRSLAAGESWAEWLDVRSVCWGTALRALEAGAVVTPHFGSSRWRGVPVARTGDARFLEVVASATPIAPAPSLESAAAPTPAVRVALASADVTSASRLTFRVTTRAGAGPVRALVRPDRFRFRVLAPDGSRHSCSIPTAGGAPLPDFFARLTTTRGTSHALDVRQFCAPRVFALEGIYEVTPLLELDASGDAWRMITPLGTFEGVPAVVRIRSGDRGYVEHPARATP